MSEPSTSTLPVETIVNDILGAIDRERERNNFTSLWAIRP